MQTELKPVLDSRKSFYKKANVITENGTITLISYSTKVAEIKDGKAKIFGTYSVTTLRHIKDFYIKTVLKLELKKNLWKCIIIIKELKK